VRIGRSTTSILDNTTQATILVAANWIGRTMRRVEQQCGCIKLTGVRIMIVSRYQTNRTDPVVLCIDDDPQVSEAIALRLRNYNVEVLRAFHGTHGLCLAVECQPDLIITDLNMPQGAGTYVIESLQNHSDTRRLPIIVLTGQRNPRLNESVYQLGAASVLKKPIHFNELAAAISKFIPLIAKD
jgi:response regulator RpfG family c-di-GMP phosphodiesterase